MFDRIIRFSINNKFIISLFVLCIVIGGVYSFYHLPIDAMPDITNNQVQIITSSPSLASSEIEKLISFPIEVAMTSLPDVTELRSVSFPGISVVTVVFKDGVDIYFARNLIFQKLQEISGDIPPELGKPEMAPLTTGLGEIYQYTLSSFEYSLAELRTIEDYVIKRQLIGIEGLAEINTHGGDVKEYEVIINPEKLNSLSLSISSVTSALLANNSNTGGGFIRFDKEQLSVRGLGNINNINDIKNITIKTDKGIPVYLKDIAEVNTGSAIRLGAATQDGKGEVVIGTAVMLRGANPNEVIKLLDERLSEIRKSLPKGINLDIFYNREDLVKKTISTITENLILGALIVILILVLLLSNIRAGLIVASVIPLSILFAAILMYLFGIQGNLMSLGAIDFGLIVDGTVIIVEYSIKLISEKYLKKHEILTKSELKDIVLHSSTEIIRYSAYGVFIIMIVYFPILSLQGIEGKLFKPLALTVIFALTGSLILSMTYVPMLSSVFLNKNLKEKENFIIRHIRLIYEPLLKKIINAKKIALVTSILIVLTSVFFLSRLGSEFIPKFDEGDLTLEVKRRITNVSLPEAVIISGKVEKLLKEKFSHEIETVVSKIGSAEIATDPTGADISDLVIKLKPRDLWTSAETRDELISKMEEELINIPGMDYSFSQPIELRFNDLLSGSSSDVSIKVFGDNLEKLVSYANQIGAIVEKVPGAKDLKIQQVEGLPELQIETDREKISRFGINIDDVNTIIKTSVSGIYSGTVYEGDQKININVKFNDTTRASLNAIKNILVQTPAGYKIPLSEVANVSIKKGYWEIGREFGKRKTVVECNVRGVDIGTFIANVQMEIDKNVNLPIGYTISYGGQFENLQNAKNRLMIVVPLTLIIIFCILYFTFKNMQYVLLIYTGIPFAIAGGIFILALRGMPFSISAGIGFIALFGVAVLNGIVLISYLSKIKNVNKADFTSQIIKGSANRLRPVLMTASVASLGFLPMAISSGAGAEVQRPLATVVIGGLITSTILTLFILPVFFNWIGEKKLIASVS